MDKFDDLQTFVWVAELASIRKSADWLFGIFNTVVRHSDNDLHWAGLAERPQARCEAFIVAYGLQLLAPCRR